MAKATLTIASKNYGSWSLRGWLLCKMAGLEFDEQIIASDDPSARAELLLLSPSFLVPCLTHNGIKVWDTLAIAEYLNEILPDAGLLPKDRAARAHCRSISGEMHSGFSNLRSALPMNLKAHHPGFKVWAGAQADIDRIIFIWRECLDAHGGIYLFGDYCSGRIWGLAAASALRGSAKAALLLDSGLSISSFGEDQKGGLYVVDLNGSVYRVTATSS